MPTDDIVFLTLVATLCAVSIGLTAAVLTLVGVVARQRRRTPLHVPRYDAFGVLAPLAERERAGRG